MMSAITALDQADQAASIGFAYAFQPIIDAVDRKIVSYEALIRGAHGEPAAQVFSHVPPEDIYRFDATSRVAAIAQATQLGIYCNLNLRAPRKTPPVMA